MTSQRNRGAYYTPEHLARFVVQRIADKMRDKNNLYVLEPSVGDGAFVKSLVECNNFSDQLAKIVVVERELNELQKVVDLGLGELLESNHEDFLNFQTKDTRTFDLIIGNPPYIKRSFLTPAQNEACAAIHQQAGLSTNKPKNIWTAFLISAISSVNEDGVIAFVLPAELLQVKFAAEIRKLLMENFQRVEIFTFSELLFPDCKGQDTVLLIAERKSGQSGVYFSNIDSVDALNNNEFVLTQNVSINDSKWNHHHISHDDIEFLNKVRHELKGVEHYCEARAGIVTAANDFFIIDKELVDGFDLDDYVKPIIQRGLFVNGSVVLTKADFRELIRIGKPAYLLALNSLKILRVNHKAQYYLAMGEGEKLHKRFKMTKRSKWYEIPNVGKPFEAFFFKRCNEYPKLIKNEAKVLVTDSAYGVTMKKDFKIENLIYSFYNSLTLAFSELDGRFYGGGVLELTPNEFKSLPVPYVEISGVGFERYVKKFEHKSSIDQISRSNDQKILGAKLSLSEEDIKRVQGIYASAINKRLGRDQSAAMRT